MKNLEEFKQICAGPVWDGDLSSKDGRDVLVKAGYVARRDGWNLLTVEGLAVAVAFELLSTNKPDRKWAAWLRSGVLTRLYVEQHVGIHTLTELAGRVGEITVNAEEAAAFTGGASHACGDAIVFLRGVQHGERGAVRLMFVFNPAIPV